MKTTLHAILCVVLIATVSMPPDAIASAAASQARSSLAPGAEVILRQTYNGSRFVYLEHAGGQVVYEHADSRLFPVTEDLPVTITEVDRDDDSLRVEFRHVALGEGSVELDLERVADPDGAIRRMVRSAFRVPGVPDDYQPIVGNRATGVAHFAGSNHLPEEPERVPFASVEEAERAGLRPCSVCFFSVPRVSNYYFERQLGKECAARFRAYNPPVQDPALQSRLGEAGTKALENWPLPLRGYPYTFELVRADEVNAGACPGGRIFVTTALLDVIEEEAELEAILAHEIGHVELRHGYRRLRSAQKASFWSALAVAAAGAATAAITKDAWDATTVGELTASLSGIASEIVLSGYGRGLEMESDSMAITYLQSNPSVGSTAAMDSVLRKLRYSQEVRGFEVSDPGMFASHPYIDDRIERASTARAASLAGTTWEGVNGRGETVATLEFILQSVSTAGDEAGLEVLANVTTTPALGESDEVDEIDIVADGMQIELDNKEDTEIFPGDSAGVMFRTDRVRNLLGRITAVDLDLRNVESWRRMEEPGTRSAGGRVAEPVSAPELSEAQAAEPTPPQASQAGAPAASEPARRSIGPRRRRGRGPGTSPSGWAEASPSLTDQAS